MMNQLLMQTMLRCLNDALDYLEHDPQRARNLMVRVIYWLEDATNGEEETEGNSGRARCD